MGYTTDFYGKVSVVPPLSAAEVAAINAFSEARHEEEEQKRYGIDFSYYCQWVATEDGAAIEWDGGEKFYEAATWMKVVIEKFIKPSGHVAHGEIEAAGEETDDRWKLIVENNVVKVANGSISYGSGEEV